MGPTKVLKVALFVSASASFADFSWKRLISSFSLENAFTTRIPESSLERKDVKDLFVEKRFA